MVWFSGNWKKVMRTNPMQNNKPTQVSNCCNAPMTVISGGEGTSYYKCFNCGHPCDEQSVVVAGASGVYYFKHNEQKKSNVNHNINCLVNHPNGVCNCDMSSYNSMFGGGQNGGEKVSPDRMSGGNSGISPTLSKEAEKLFDEKFYIDHVGWRGMGNDCHVAEIFPYDDEGRQVVPDVADLKQFIAQIEQSAILAERERARAGLKEWSEKADQQGWLDRKQWHDETEIESSLLDHIGYFEAITESRE